MNFIDNMMSTLIRINLLLLPAILVSSWRCAPDQSIVIGKSGLKNFPLLFGTSETASKQNNIHYTFQLSSNEAGDTLLFLALIANRNDDTLYVEKDYLEIETASGMRSGVIGSDTSRLTILPKQQNLLRFYFQPITNLEMYNCIGYRGDLDSIYFIESDFIYNQRGPAITSQRVKFSLPQEVQRAYKATFAMEPKIKLFEFDDQEGVKEKIETALNKKYTGSESEHPSRVQVSKNDLLIAGTLIRMHFYTLDSVLHLRLRVVNHGEQSLSIEPGSIIVQERGNEIPPKVISAFGSAVQLTDSSYLVRGGDRFEVNAVFPLNVDNFSLSLANAVEFNTDESALFIQPIEFSYNGNHIIKPHNHYGKNSIAVSHASK